MQDVSSIHATTSAHAVRAWVASILCAAFACGFVLRADAGSLATLSDVRCVIVGLRMAEMTMPQQRVAGTMLSVYYLGRLDGRATDAEIEAMVEKEAKRMTAPELRANAVRCGKALTLKGREIQKIGADLSRKTSHSTIKK